MSITGFDLSKLLSDPNVQSIMAGIGARLDPEGVGGALGTATQQFVQAQASQKALAGQEKGRMGQSSLLAASMMPPGPEKDALMKRGIEMLGLTPPGTPGLSGVKMGPKGQIITEFDPPGTVGTAKEFSSQPLQITQPIQGASPAPVRRDLNSIVPF